MTTITAPGAQRLHGLFARIARLGGSMVISSAFLLTLAVVAVLAPVIAPHDPTSTDLSAIYQGVSPDHPLGADELGRDTLSRLIWATRVSLAAPMLVIALATTLGFVIALATAWRGGRFDSVTTGALDILMGFPGILLAILAVAFFGAGLAAPIVALTIAYTPYFARLTRSVAKREMSQTYVSALTQLGFGGLRTTIRHVTPNIMPFAVAQAAVLFAYATVDLAALSFLGLGVQPPAADWGSMVAVGQSGVLQGHPLPAIAAGVMIILTVMALNVLGEGVADRTSRGSQ
jgi:peptide/nickel transport system permease protein